MNRETKTRAHKELTARYLKIEGFLEVVADPKTGGFLLKVQRAHVKNFHAVRSFPYTVAMGGFRVTLEAV